MAAFAGKVLASARQGSPGRSVLVVLSAACLCVTLGAMISTGGRPGGAVAGLVASSALLYLGIGALRFRAVTFWVALTALAFPFLRYPQTQAVLTFDRVWIIASAACLVQGVVRPATNPASRLLVRALMLFVVAYGLRAALSPGSQLHALSTWFDALLLPSILFAVTRREVRTTRHCDRLARVFMVCGAFLGALAVAERIFGFELASLSGGTLFIDKTVGSRVSGPFTTPDVLAVSLLLCFAMTMFWLQANRHHRVLGGSIAVLELAGIALTFFRGAWIAAMLIAIVALGLRPKRFARFGGVAAMGLLISLGVFAETYGSEQLGARVGNTENVNSRVASYVQSFHLFEGHPVFGVGVSQYTLASGDVAPLKLATFGGIQAVPYAHNSYLYVLAEQGLVGIASFLLLTYAAGAVARRLLRLARTHADVLFGSAIVAALLAYFLLSMELEILTAPTANALLAVLLGAAAARVDVLATTRTKDASGRVAQ